MCVALSVVVLDIWDLSGMRQTTFVANFLNAEACRGVCGLSGWLCGGSLGAEANNEGKQK